MNWNDIDKTFLKRLISDPAFSAENIARKLIDQSGCKPTRSALLGYVGRRPELQEIWANSRKRPVKKVAKPKPVIVTMNGLNVLSDHVLEPVAAFRKPPTPAKPALPARRKERRVPLLELRMGECKFPVEEFSPDEVVGRFHFCGSQVTAGKAYCAFHARIVYVQRMPVATGKFVLTERKPNPQPKKVSKLLAKKA